MSKLSKHKWSKDELGILMDARGSEIFKSTE